MVSQVSTVQKMVLVVEDEAALSQVLAEKVKQLGCRVTVAKDGEEALQKIIHDKPDLVLLDIIMPKYNGFDVLQKIRAKSTYIIPVIILSNLETAKDRETSHSYDVVDYIVKSNVSLRSLMRLVSQTLSLKA